MAFSWSSMKYYPLSFIPKRQKIKQELISYVRMAIILATPTRFPLLTEKRNYLLQTHAHIDTHTHTYSELQLAYNP